ncbi:elongation factor P [Patescibacteria group bacterium]|nr:elongation factor P [Patescibacteria group bacterium]MBU2219084.1 elongation factor P [Patescibacteria group bacterium]MBU2263567.1 elongation factor P [Patescibacteria group bacterium]
MLSYNELKPGVFIILDGQPYVVMEFKFLRMQQRKPVTQTKIKNIISGKTIEKTFQQTDKLEEAEIETRPVKYLYHRPARRSLGEGGGEFWFSEKDNPSVRFKLDESLVGNYIDLLKPNSLIEAMSFQKNIIGVKMPVKVDLKVVEAPPAVKGNTAQGGTKQVKLETGAAVNVPLFINEGDIIRINTETKQYTERAEKGS